MPPTAKFANLTSLQRSVMKLWLARVNDDEEGYRGLWTYGPRCAGSSYIAQVGYDSLVKSGYSAHRIDAIRLVESIRRWWTLSDSVRQHSEDYGLWFDCNQLETSLDFLWDEVGVLWVDNMHHESVNLPFWNKHVQPHLEQNLREGRVVIVSTTAPPKFPELPTNVIPNYFVCVEADAAR